MPPSRTPPVFRAQTLPRFLTSLGELDLGPARQTSVLGALQLRYFLIVLDTLYIAMGMFDLGNLNPRPSNSQLLVLSPEVQNQLTNLPVSGQIRVQDTDPMAFF